jgi:hypothetical protein
MASLARMGVLLLVCLLSLARAAEAKEKGSFVKEYNNVRTTTRGAVTTPPHIAPQYECLTSLQRRQAAVGRIYWPACASRQVCLR